MSPGPPRFCRRLAKFITSPITCGTEHRHRTGCDADAATGIRPGNGYFRYSLAYLDCRSYCLIGIILPRFPEAEINTNAIPLQPEIS